jgi:S-adenosylmethionine hydrolase
MPIITLTSDMGLSDHYVSAVKGAIYSQLPQARIVDISHDISPFDISQAAFVLRNAYHHFPAGSIHIIGVNPEIDLHAGVMHVLVKHKKHYFIGADNGIYSLMFSRVPDEIYELNLTQAVDDLTFPTKDVFVPAACHIARGGTAEVIGRRKKELLQRSMFQPVIEPNAIRGSIIYIDSYGNAIANITRQLFREVGKGRAFRLLYGGRSEAIREISDAYNNVSEGERLALFGSEGYLEIAINRGAHGAGGSAHTLLGLRVNQSVRIEFV